MTLDRMKIVGVGDPSTVRLALYDSKRRLVREIMHDNGAFREPVTVDEGAYIAMVRHGDRHMSIVYRG